MGLTGSIPVSPTINLQKRAESELPTYAGLTGSVVAFMLVSLATEHKAPGAAASRRIEWG